MSQIRELLVDGMQDMLNAENQLIEALPKMSQAAKNPKLKEAFEKHLMQTQGQAERLKQAFEMLGETPGDKNCRAMQGLIEEGQEKIKDSRQKDSLGADLCLITAAQKVEHYEIASYGTLRELARQIGEYEVARLLMQSLGEEESADFLLTEITKPLLQDALVAELEPVGTRA